MPGPKPKPLMERLWARSYIDPDSECWVWDGRVFPNGYGALQIGSKTDRSVRNALVHRVAYEQLVGSINDTIDHTCENKRCWNPAHLEDVTRAENKRRGGERMKTCRRGHQRTSENVYVAPDGKKQCRVCNRLRKRVTTL